MEDSAILSPPLEKQSIRSLSSDFPGKFHLKKFRGRILTVFSVALFLSPKNGRKQKYRAILDRCGKKNSLNRNHIETPIATRRKQ